MSKSAAAEAPTLNLREAVMFITGTQLDGIEVFDIIKRANGDPLHTRYETKEGYRKLNHARELVNLSIRLPIPEIPTGLRDFEKGDFLENWIAENKASLGDKFPLLGKEEFAAAKKKLITEKKRGYDTIKKLLKEKGLSGAVHFSDHSDLSHEIQHQPYKLSLMGANNLGNLPSDDTTYDDIMTRVNKNTQAAVAALQNAGIQARFIDANQSEDQITRLEIDMNEQNMAVINRLASQQLALPSTGRSAAEIVAKGDGKADFGTGKA